MGKMLKLLAITIVAAALSFASPALAAPVTGRTAKRAIRHWWHGPPAHPRILWCAPRKDGTLCALRFSIDVERPAGWVRGRDTKLIWVSRTRGRLSVADLGDFLSVALG